MYLHFPLPPPAVFCRLLAFVSLSFSLCASCSLLTLSINTLSTPQSHFSICHERMLYILPPWSLYPGAISEMAAVICCGREGVWMCHSHGTEPYWVCLCQAQRGYSLKAREGHRGWETASQRKGDWGHFLSKEIKVKRMIKVRFPASWFVFCTEIPFFLSVFAETTIGPFPVLVTVTLINPISGRRCTVTFIIRQVNSQLLSD